MDFKSMVTPMVANLKKLKGFHQRLVDPSMYHQLIGSLTYLVSTRLGIYFVVNILREF